MNILATVQVRMGSTRLPGKALLEILDKPVLELMLERIRRSQKITQIVIATSTSRKDDCLEEFCQKKGLLVFRGSEEDVLSRIAQANAQFKADVGVEFMADNPLPEPEIIDGLIEQFLDSGYDLLTNGLKTTFSPGLEVTVFKSQALFAAARLAQTAEEREHAMLYIHCHPEKYKILNIEAEGRYQAFRYPDLHLELDTQEDFTLIKFIYEKFYPLNPEFKTLEAINFLRDNPQVAGMNKGVFRRWKEYRKD